MEHPTNLMTITAVFTFAEPFPLDDARRLAERLLRFDRFHERVVEQGALGRPAWEPDPSFDLANHVLPADLAPDASLEALEALVGGLMSTPLPYDRPLWQLHHVASFQGGSAIVARVHHCVADGMSLVQVLLHLADEPPVLPAIARTAGAAARGEQRAPSAGALSPRRLVDAARVGGSLAQAIAGILDLRADPRTPFRGALGREKRAVWSDPIPLDEVKAVGRRLGATVNDVLLSTVAGALRRYLDDHDVRAEGITLRAVVPVNLRPPHDVALGNKFGMVFLPLPVGHRDAHERLRALKRAMDRIKRSPEAVVIFGLLRAFGTTTTRLLKLAVNVLGRKATAVMTNVPGPTEPVRFFGRAVDTMMFWVPQSGRLGLGVSILSYCGQVRLGVATDAGLVPDPETMIAAFHESFDQLKNEPLLQERTEAALHAKQPAQHGGRLPVRAEEPAPRRETHRR
jgi:WS/DGAT/MGAT family acyltransferase